MARIFVSYYRHDERDARLANRLVADLSRLGHSPFIDHQIPAGTEFDEHIRARLLETDVFVLLLTRGAHESQWVRAELRVASRLAAARRRPRIIPLVLESFADDWRMEWHVILDPLNFVTCLEVERDWAAAVALIVRELTPGVAPAVATALPIDGELIRLGVSPIAWRRAALVDEAARRARDTKLPVVLLGLPGVGKTTLLHHVARQLRPEVEHLVAMPLAVAEGTEPAYGLEVLNVFLTALGRGVGPERLRRQPETRSLEELAAALTDVDVAVLVDAIERVPPAWGERLLGTLCAGRARIVVTGRFRVGRAPAHVITVPVLSQDEAREFVAHHARALDVDVNPEALLPRLPESVRGHPQALSAIVAALRDVSLEDLLGFGLPDDARAPLAVVTAAVAALEPRVRRALALLVTLRETALASTLDALGMPAPAGFLADLSDLLGRAFVHRLDSGYEVPAITREALAAADPDALRETLESNVAAFTRAGTARVPGMLAGVATRLAAAATECRRWDLVATVAHEERLEALNRAGLWTAYSLLLRLGIDAARERGDQRTHQRFSLRLVRKGLQLRDAASARATMASIGEPIDSVGDTLERAEYLSHHALLVEEAGDAPGALVALGESAAIRERLGDHEGLAVVLGLAGHIQLRLSDYPRAREAYEAARELTSQVATKEGVEHAWGLGMCALREGDLDGAERFSREGLHVCSLISYDAGRPRLELMLALVHERRGRLAEARTAALSALVRAEAFYPAVAAMAQVTLRRIERAMKDGQ